MLTITDALRFAKRIKTDKDKEKEIEQRMSEGQKPEKDFLNKETQSIEESQRLAKEAKGSQPVQPDTTPETKVVPTTSTKTVDSTSNSTSSKRKTATYRFHDDVKDKLNRLKELDKPDPDKIDKMKKRAKFNTIAEGLRVLSEGIGLQDGAS